MNGHLALHQKAINKIKAKLFWRLSEQEYFMIPGSLSEITPPGNPAARSEGLGGVRFQIAHPNGGDYTVEVSHSVGDMFDIAIFADRAHSVRFTMFVVTCPFEFIDRRVLELIGKIPS